MENMNERKGLKTEFEAFFSRRPRCKSCAHFCKECLEIRPNDTRFNKDSLCWCCKKVLTEECTWHHSHIPILGWVADNGKRDGVTTYNVKSCPDFVRG